MSDTIRLRIPEQLRREYPPAGPEPAVRKGGRDRYLDLLRALALVRVVLYHNFGWFFLPLVFPSMGVMFALAGSLMARSLSRPALGVIRSRLRRLLPPMWLFGAIVVTLQVLDGGGPGSDGHPTWWWAKLAFWVLPLSTPPYATDGLHGLGGHLESGWATQLVVPLWYLRAYLWYVLLSPLLLKALRRFPLVTLFAPLALVIAMNGFFPEHDFVWGRVWETVNDFAMFGSCWILGMAHQEGMLKRIPQYVLPSIAPLIMVAGFWYLQTRPFDPTEPTDIEAWPIAQAVWSFGFVALLLHISPSWEQWPPRLERWNGLVSLLNSRAVSVYLWHVTALVAAVPLIDLLWDVDFFRLHLRWLLTSRWFTLLIGIPLLALLVLVFGWVEDVAAKRRPRLFPYPRRPRGRRRIG
ncbi:acyltransferase family protein [Kitasatospora cheerisanensis]|uniref:Integral membrane protein n=1 Tax=Kitasatospora cheerisanensis KCTC 2395 TaxID=1348663 RepID=A0A066YUR4_9ACTN|nr:acyltransferase [Kitasatospora cheerisanensis]KDN81841.1 integral membrane protein [Kitasatospora cheerisanensis KCTC 2395]